MHICYCNKCFYTTVSHTPQLLLMSVCVLLLLYFCIFEYTHTTVCVFKMCNTHVNNYNMFLIYFLLPFIKPTQKYHSPEWPSWRVILWNINILNVRVDLTTTTLKSIQTTKEGVQEHCQLLSQGAVVNGIDDVSDDEEI